MSVPWKGISYSLQTHVSLSSLCFFLFAYIEITRTKGVIKKLSLERVITLLGTCMMTNSINKQLYHNGNKPMVPKYNKLHSSSVMFGWRKRHNIFLYIKMQFSEGKKLPFIQRMGKTKTTTTTTHTFWNIPGIQLWFP